MVVPRYFPEVVTDEQSIALVRAFTRQLLWSHTSVSVDGQPYYNSQALGNRKPNLW